MKTWVKITLFTSLLVAVVLGLFIYQGYQHINDVVRIRSEFKFEPIPPTPERLAGKDEQELLQTCMNEPERFIKRETAEKTDAKVYCECLTANMAHYIFPLMPEGQRRWEAFRTLHANYEEMFAKMSVIMEYCAGVATQPE